MKNRYGLLCKKQDKYLSTMVVDPDCKLMCRLDAFAFNVGLFVAEIFFCPSNVVLKVIAFDWYRTNEYLNHVLYC